MLESLEHIIDRGPEPRVPHQDILQEVDQVDVVVDLVQTAILKQVQLRLGQPHKEPDKLISVKQHLTRQQLIEEATQAPYIR